MPKHSDRVGMPPSVDVPVGAPPWVTRELIEHTLHIWQSFYAAPLIPEDALEIIMSADRMMELLSRGRRDETVRRAGKGEQP